MDNKVSHGMGKKYFYPKVIKTKRGQRFVNNHFHTYQCSKKWSSLNRNKNFQKGNREREREREQEREKEF